MRYYHEVDGCWHDTDSATSAEDLLAEVRVALENEWGVKFPLSHVDPDGAVRLAEWANWSAKRTGRWDLKARAFVGAAMLPGVEAGWSDDVFYIQGPVGPQASAHDPFDEIWDLLEELAPELNHAVFPHGWDGVHRQPWAFHIAEMLPAVRECYLLESPNLDSRIDALLPVEF